MVITSHHQRQRRRRDMRTWSRRTGRRAADDAAAAAFGPVGARNEARQRGIAPRNAAAQSAKCSIRGPEETAQQNIEKEHLRLISKAAILVKNRRCSTSDAGSAAETAIKISTIGQHICCTAGHRSLHIRCTAADDRRQCSRRQDQSRMSGNATDTVHGRQNPTSLSAMPPPGLVPRSRPLQRRRPRFDIQCRSFEIFGGCRRPHPPYWTQRRSRMFS